MKHNAPKFTQGIAVVTVLILLVVTATLVSVTSLLALGNQRGSKDSISTVQAQYAAEAGIEMALKRVYHEPKANWAASADATGKDANGNPVQFDACAFKKWLTGIPDTSKTATAQTADIKANNAVECPYSLYTAQVGAKTPVFPPGNAATSSNILLPGTTMTVSSVDTGAETLTNANYTVKIRRTDDLKTGDFTLEMDSIGQVLKGANIIAEKRINRSIKIAGEIFEGDRFAMLATQANCSFCHLHVDTMRRAYSSTTGAKFDRAKIGFVANDTNGLGIPGTAHAGDYKDVLIYGTIYTRSSTIVSGNATTEPISAIMDASGKVNQGSNASNSSGTGSELINTTKATNAGIAAGITPYKHSYYNYPTQAQVDDANGIYKKKWPDGPMPDGFPAAIPDGGDFNISDTEWANYVSTAPNGKVSNAQAAVFYGVRHPGNSTVEANIPVTYDPISANGITDNNASPTLGQITLTPSNYKAWMLYSALSSPNNRDFMPTALTTGTFTPSPAVPFNVSFPATGIDQSLANNFYVRYIPQATPSNNLSLTYCLNPATCAGTTMTSGSTTNPSVASALPTGMTSIAISLNDTDLFPKSSNKARDDLVSGTYSKRAGYFDGNLIIDAGRINPDSGSGFTIDGTLLINGDLVIRGRVSGQGRIVARGNIYVVGDLVYDCGSTGSYHSCTTSDYSNIDSLPKLALLAGGNIVVGDFDVADSRMGTSSNQGDNNRAFDLLNDQNGQNRRPVTSIGAASVTRATGTITLNSIGNFAVDTEVTVASSATLPTPLLPNVKYYIKNINGNDIKLSASKGGTTIVFATGGTLPLVVTSTDSSLWSYASIPGSSGHAPRNTADNNVVGSTDYSSGNWDGRAGLITRVLQKPNGRANPKRLFKTNPFGFILGSTSDSPGETYENSGFFYPNTAITAITASILPLYPSNGPLKVGDGGTTASGLSSYLNATGTATTTLVKANVGCKNATDTTTVGGLPVRRYGGSPTFNFTYWCAESNATGGYVRVAATSAIRTNPASDSTAWISQSTQDQALYNSNGLTSGWLGGLINYNGLKRGDQSGTRLLKMMWLSSIEGGRTKGPLRTDGIFYSANMISSTLRGTLDARDSGDSAIQSRWVHNGSVIASELGFLITANTQQGTVTVGKKLVADRTDLQNFAPGSGVPDGSNLASWGGMSVIYDDRLVGLLQVQNTKSVVIKRTGVFTQVSSK
jgi:hypothetical protein